MGNLPSHAELKSALVEARGKIKKGLQFHMWGAIVNRDGFVTAVAFTGSGRGDQWPGSRIIAAQKAHTANAFSLPQFALSTANLFSAVQPGGSLYGLQHSNPVDGSEAYSGDPTKYGQKDDPLVGKKIGGVNVFGGGLGLYDSNGELIGAIGVSGDTSTADHNIAWVARQILKLDYVPAGVSGDSNRPDNIIYLTGDKPEGFKHPTSGFGEESESPSLPEVQGKR